MAKAKVVPDTSPKAAPKTKAAPKKKTESFRGSHEPTVDSQIDIFVEENNISEYKIREIVYPNPAGDEYWTKTIEYK